MGFFMPVLMLFIVAALSSKAEKMEKGKEIVSLMNHKICPFCDEGIEVEAELCPFCGEGQLGAIIQPRFIEIPLKMMRGIKIRVLHRHAH